MKEIILFHEYEIMSVAFFANELHLSPNYFDYLVKKKIGKLTKEYIQSRLIESAKEKVYGTNKEVSEIPYELGVKYTQHFSCLFKKKVGP
ncbi:MAG: AraC family transcriptional regulator [Eudoraea sp.]|uniref:helix-turn-helix domain-containing protein n=1 Tax=Eudoraea sp. TaxID=1979955 RepID=UPI003C739F24